jgi:RNA-binding protein YhbY
MLIYRFEEIKMLEEDTFGEFDTKINDLRNSMVNLGKTVLDVKLIRKILRSLPERFRIKVTTIEERKDLDEMKIEELVGSLQSYEYSLPLVKKAKTIALKESKKKAMLAKNFGRLMKAPRESEPEEAEKKDPRGPRCFECSGFGHIRADSGNLKQAKRKAYNATLNDESEEEEETPAQDQKFLAFVAPHEDEEDSQSYYFELSDEDGEELNEAYKVLYVEYLKLMETRQQQVHELNSLQI